VEICTILIDSLLENLTVIHRRTFAEVTTKSVFLWSGEVGMYAYTHLCIAYNTVYDLQCPSVCPSLCPSVLLRALQRNQHSVATSLNIQNVG